MKSNIYLLDNPTENQINNFYAIFMKELANLEIKDNFLYDWDIVIYPTSPIVLGRMKRFIVGVMDAAEEYLEVVGSIVEKSLKTVEIKYEIQRKKRKER